MVYRAFVSALMATVASSAAAESQWLSHDMSFSLQQGLFSSGLKPHKNVIQFWGNALVDVTEAQSAAGVVTNPLYKDKGVKGTNPLCGETDHLRSQDVQFEIPDIISIEIDFAPPTWDLRSANIVHRDLATRNVLVSTRFGDYSSAAGDSFSFVSEGAFDAFASDGKPPIRWSAPEVLRLFRDGDVNSSDWIDIEAGATLSTVVIPAPSTLVALACGGVCAKRRRH